LASLGVSLEGRSSSQGDSVDLELRHCVSEGTLSELDLAHVSKCALGRQQGWLKEIVQEAKKIVAPKGTFRESKMSHRFGGYVAPMSSISDAEPSSFEEEDKLQVWKDAMLEEYRSILKNNVLDIVPRPMDKSGVSSKWIYKIKHVANGSGKVQSKISSQRLHLERRN
jgi:hypothetical protein